MVSEATFTLTTRGARWVAVCDWCEEEVAAGASKVGVTVAGELHVAKHQPVKRRGGRYISYPDQDVAYVNYYTDITEVNEHVFVTSCLKCEYSVKGWSRQQARGYMQMHCDMRHSETPLIFSPAIAAILEGHAPTYPEHPPF